MEDRTAAEPLIRGTSARSRRLDRGVPPRNIPGGAGFVRDGICPQANSAAVLDPVSGFLDRSRLPEATRGLGPRRAPADDAILGIAAISFD